MKKEIEDFFAGQNLPVDRIIDTGVEKHSLKKEYIKRAIEELHAGIATGWKLKRNELAWKVFDLARSGYSTAQVQAHLPADMEAPPPFTPPQTVVPAFKPEIIETPDPKVVIGVQRRGLFRRLVPAFGMAVLVAAFFVWRRL